MRITLTQDNLKEALAQFITNNFGIQEEALTNVEWKTIRKPEAQVEVDLEIDLSVETKLQKDNRVKEGLTAIAGLVEVLGSHDEDEEPEDDDFDEEEEDNLITAAVKRKLAELDEDENFDEDKAYKSAVNNVVDSLISEIPNIPPCDHPEEGDIAPEQPSLDLGIPEPHEELNEAPKPNLTPLTKISEPLEEEEEEEFDPPQPAPLKKIFK